MTDEREIIVEALCEGILIAWDLTTADDETDPREGAKAMANAALGNLEAAGYKVVRVES